MKKLIRQITHLCLIACLVSLLPARASAWGGEGHRITARVAWARMKQSTRKKIIAILGSEAALRPAATWPDTLYGNPQQYSYTFKWHFVDIPTDSNHKYLASRDCKQSAGECVIKALAAQRLVLKNASSSAGKRLNALRFIIHFMGDLHQPLHCAEDQGDAGGNGKAVCFFGVCAEQSGKKYNLHMTWDKLMIQHTKVSEDKYVQNIVNRIKGMSQSELNDILAGDTVAWAEDAHQIAFNHAYDLPDPTTKKKKTYYDLGQAYQDANIGFVDEQLLKGGVRLAAMLDEIFS
jgi:hypothetical protein